VLLTQHESTIPIPQLCTQGFWKGGHWGSFTLWDLWPTGIATRTRSCFWQFNASHLIDRHRVRQL